VREGVLLTAHSASSSKCLDRAAAAWPAHQTSNTLQNVALFCMTAGMLAAA
jgi:hypothetical protein